MKMLAPLFFLTVWASISLGNVTVLSPAHMAGEFITGPLQIQPLQFNVTGEAFYLPNGALCDEDTLAGYAMQLAGKIVFVSYDSDEAFPCVGIPAEFVVKLHMYNPLALVIREAQAVGEAEVEDDPSVADGISLPSVTLAHVDFEKVTKELTNGGTVILNVQRPTSNPWITLVRGPAGITLQVIGILLVIATIVIGIYKISSFIKVFGLQVSVTQVCLLLDIVACIIRLVMLVDPLGYYGIWRIQHSAVMAALSSPFSLASVLLIAFYWCNIVSAVGDYNRASNWLQGKKKQYFATVGGIFGILFILSFIDIGSKQQGVASLALLSILAIISFLVAIFFLVNGYKVLQVLKTTSAIKEKKKQKLRSFTFLIAVMGIAELLVVASLAILALQRQTNAQVLGATFNFYYWSFAVSLVVVLAFQPPTGKPSSSGGSATIVDAKATSQDVSLQTVVTN